MIIAAGFVAVIADVLALIWATQRRFMYFPTEACQRSVTSG